MISNCRVDVIYSIRITCTACNRITQLSECKKGEQIWPSDYHAVEIRLCSDSMLSGTFETSTNKLPDIGTKISAALFLSRRDVQLMFWNSFKQLFSFRNILRSSVLKSKNKKRFTWLINGKASPSLIVTQQERKVLQTGGEIKRMF